MNKNIQKNISSKTIAMKNKAKILVCYDSSFKVFPQNRVYNSMADVFYQMVDCILQIFLHFFFRFTIMSVLICFKKNVFYIFTCSTQVSMKFILLINVKMPTIVGILTFISRINTTPESFKSRNAFIFQGFNFYELLKSQKTLQNAIKWQTTGFHKQKKSV